MLIFDQLNRADRQLRVVSWVIALGLAVLVGGLWWVQVVRARSYAEELRTQSYRTIRVPAPRGKILDRNGIALAENRPSYNVSLYLEDRTLRGKWQQEYRTRRNAVLKARGKKRLPLAEQMALERECRYFVVSNVVQSIGEHIGEPLAVQEESFHKHYKQRLALPLPVISSLNSTQLARIQERSLALPGVDMETQPLRVYPYGSVASHVLGYLTRSVESAENELAYYDYRLPDYRGQSALEYSMDSALRGKAGVKSVLVNNLGYRQSETILSPVEPGSDVMLTLDLAVQRATEAALENAATQKPVRGAAVAIDVRTGEVLALASAPSFDPNHFIPAISVQDYSVYNDTNYTPMLNRAIYGGYPPGSTFKIMVALAALEAGALNPADVFRSEGVTWIGRRAIGDTAGAGDFDFRRAFIKSSNPYFVDYGLRIGHERLAQFSEQFLFGTRTGIPLGQDSAGLLPTPEWARRNRGGWSSGDTANMSIGQGDLLVTPLQLSLAIAAVANGGKVLKPQLVLRVQDPDEFASEQPPVVRPVVRGNLNVSRRSLDIVRAAMVADVEDAEGTAYKGFHPGNQPLLRRWRACGKTGTAENRNRNTVWFAAYAPYEDPRYAVVVMVDYGAGGGSTCAPIAARIFKALEDREDRGGKPGTSLAKGTL